MLGSFPLFSDFKLGRFAGGGIRRAVATFPRLCKPCLGITAGRRRETDPARWVTEAEARPFSCSYKPSAPDKGSGTKRRGGLPGKPTALPGGHSSHLTSPWPRPWRTRKLPSAQQAEGSGAHDLCRASPAPQSHTVSPFGLMTAGLKGPRLGRDYASLGIHKTPRGRDSIGRNFPTTFQSPGTMKPKPGESNANAAPF